MGAMIDEQAVVKAAAEAEIEADAELCWSVLTDINSWSSWNPDVKSASLEAPVMKGTTFRWKVSGGSIASTFIEVVPPRLVAWTGRLSPLGIRAVHVWNLNARDGSTLVRSEESWSGLVPRIARSFSARLLKASLDKGLESLKRECERRAAAQSPLP